MQLQSPTKADWDGFIAYCIEVQQEQRPVPVVRPHKRMPPGIALLLLLGYAVAGCLAIYGVIRGIESL